MTKITPDQMRKIYHTDPALHKKMSSNGGKKSAKKRRDRKLEEEVWENEMTATAQAERINARMECNEHITPIDTDDEILLIVNEKGLIFQ